jgi:hypothetical protein
MSDDFISEDDLLAFDGWMKYQAIDPAMRTPDELKMWRKTFDKNLLLRESSPKVGRMKLQPVPGEQKYAVAIRDEDGLWLTMWVRCSRKGEIFIMYPRGNRDWDAHASYDPAAVLGAVNDAARRLRRWPAALIDRPCARRLVRSAGRDEGTVALRSNQGTSLLMSMSCVSRPPFLLVAQHGVQCGQQLSP